MTCNCAADALLGAALVMDNAMKKVIVKKDCKINGRYALKAGQVLPDPAYPDWLAGHVINAGLGEYVTRRKVVDLPAMEDEK